MSRHRPAAPAAAKHALGHVAHNAHGANGVTGAHATRRASALPVRPSKRRKLVVIAAPKFVHVPAPMLVTGRHGQAGVAAPAPESVALGKSKPKTNPAETAAVKAEPDRVLLSAPGVIGAVGADVTGKVLAALDKWRPRINPAVTAAAKAALAHVTAVAGGIRGAAGVAAIAKAPVHQVKSATVAVMHARRKRALQVVNGASAISNRGLNAYGKAEQTGNAAAQGNGNSAWAPIMDVSGRINVKPAQVVAASRARRPLPTQAAFRSFQDTD